MSLQDFLFYFILPILGVSLLLIFYRMYKGPRVEDRVVALDLTITCGLGIIAVYSIITNQDTFLDIAMVMALIGFLGNIAFAYYLIKRHRND